MWCRRVRSRKRVVDVFNRYPDRSCWDRVAPADQAAQLRVYELGLPSARD
jgi:hypothetical protein